MAIRVRLPHWAVVTLETLAATILALGVLGVAVVLAVGVVARGWRSVSLIGVLAMLTPAYVAIFWLIFRVQMLLDRLDGAADDSHRALSLASGAVAGLNDEPGTGRHHARDE